MRGILTVCFMISVFFTGGLASSANAAPLVAKVDLSKQIMNVYVDGKRRYSWRVSTGKRGWRTPTGRFSPIASYRSKYVKRWGMTLPWAVVIKSSGIAVHGSNGPMGTPRSHGCIRLPNSNAAKFYKLVHKYGYWGTSVVVKQ
jgi:lipoprotein-anchoring transpeptidase ErfK/SrfK